MPPMAVMPHPTLLGRLTNIKTGSAAEIYALSKSKAVLPYLFGLVGLYEILQH